MNQAYGNSINLVSFSNYDSFNNQILNGIIKAKKNLLIGSFSFQNIRIKLQNRYIKFSRILGNLIQKGVAVYILSQPGACRSSIIRELKQLYGDNKNLMIRSCSRVHLKTIIIDLKIAYIGSANITGHGLGTRSKSKRNFELGFITTKTDVISKVARNFLDILNGNYCNSKDCYYYLNSKSKRSCNGIR
ncbi:MAG: hypothetical protein GF329_21430 [Candidatus Lokiarchaeota archaeon]|nr:hypothetical protein [Candidatus Lokiarchaeota archaeon]